MPTTDLVPVSTAPSTTDVLALVGPASDLAGQMAKTTFVPKEYRGNPAELLAAILTGYELGLPPMTSMSKIHNIQGRAGLSAELMRALPLAAGHAIWIEEVGPTKVVVAGHRRGDPDHVTRITWTLDMAKTAGLATGNVWRKYPQAMLTARATGDLCRAIFADCLAGISYTVEELEDPGFDPDDLGAVEATPTEAPEGAAKPPARTSKRSSKNGSQRKATRQEATPPPAAAAPPLPPLPGEEEAPVAAAPPTDESQRKLSDAIRIRTEEILGAMDRDDRLAFWSASAAREITSGKDLTYADAELITIDLDLIAADEQAWTGGQIVATETAELDEGDEGHEETGEPTLPLGGNDEAGWTPEEWKEFRTDHGLSHADLIKAAQSIDPDVSPSSLPAIVSASSEFKAALRRHVEEA